MKITQIREKDGVEALSVLDFNLLIEKIKTEIKTRPVTGLREVSGLFYQFLKLWIGAGILPPRCTNASQENWFTGMIGA